ncbi:MAG: hypothetical protein WCE45_07530 [Sedimentisphaerales bacterium]
MITPKLLLDTLNSVPKKFAKNELAYLSLTGAIEHPFRDKWAFILYKKLFNRGFIVSREWNKRDLVILRNQSNSKPEPKVLIELKLMYTSDAQTEKSRAKFIQKLKDDEKKAKKAQKMAVQNCDIYLVLLMVNPCKPIEEKYGGIIKYHKKINSALKKHITPKEVKKNAIREIQSCFKKAKFIRPRFSKCGIGKAFGVEAELLYWLIKR